MNLSHSDLVDRASSWLRNTVNCGVVLAEIVTDIATGEQPDAIGFKSGGISILVECKASRADFKVDAKKHFRKNPACGVGLYRFYMCPAGLIG